MNNVVSDKNKIIFKLDINSTNFKKNRYAIYYLLNEHEDKKNIFFKDLPYCYIPDAFDHVIYRPDIKKLKRIKQCRDCRINKICLGIEKNSIFDINSSILKPVLKVPNEVVIELCERCVMDCVMCSKDKKLNLFVDFSKVKKIIDEAKKIGVKNIRFTGGEPLLHPDIHKIILYARKKGMYIILNTSLILSKKQIKLIKGIDNILISLHGFDRKTEKEITQRDFFDLKLKNIDYLSPIVKTIRVGSVITKKFISNFEKYLKIIPDNVSVWELYRPIIFKKKTDIYKNFNLSISDFKKLLKKISDTKTTFKIVIGNSLPFCLFDEKYYKYLLGAIFNDGNTRIVYDMAGYFKPSHHININIGKTILKSWNNNFLKKITYNRRFKSKCKKCIYLFKCYAGSRSMAFIDKKRYDLDDPFL